MTDDRSERLRKRRRSARHTADRQQSGAAASGGEQSSQHRQTADPTDDDEPNRTDTETGRGDATTNRAGEAADGADEERKETNSIKEKQVGTYMYLPESQTKDLRRLYNVLKAEYEFEYDEEFEKNRHFYPLVIQHGLDGLDGLDASEIRTRLHELR